MWSEASYGSRMGGRKVLGEEQASDCNECDGWLGCTGALEKVSYVVDVCIQSLCCTIRFVVSIILILEAHLQNYTIADKK